MQFKTLLLASGLILGASATSAGNATQNATDIAPAVQARLAQIDLGYQKTYLLLNHLGDHTANVTTDVSNTGPICSYIVCSISNLHCLRTSSMPTMLQQVVRTRLLPRVSLPSLFLSLPSWSSVRLTTLYVLFGIEIGVQQILIL